MLVKRAPIEEVPLILTLEMDALLFNPVQALRKAHFPPERNFLPAHITLFHNLPSAHRENLICQLRERSPVLPVELVLQQPRNIGRGVALTVISEGLIRLRTDLANRWESWLTPQDKQKYRPHVTIQNKAEPAVAHQLFAELSSRWTPLHGSGTALLLWYYRNGPWELCERIPLDSNREP